MNGARALGIVALVIAVLAAGVVVCPCARHAADRGHDCCGQQETALRAAGSDCCARPDAAIGVAASMESGPAVVLIEAVDPLAAPTLASYDATRHAASLVLFSPPTVLRI